jgi:hypothetical protein
MLTVQPVNADVFLSGPLLRLDQSGRPVDANDEASCHLGIKGARVTSFFDAENPLDPCHDLVRAGIGRLVQIENAALDVFRKGSLKG